MPIISNLSEIMKKKGITYEELQFHSKVAPDTVARARDERISTCKLITLEKLANAVGSTEKKVDGLCKDVDEMKAKPGKKWEALAMDVIKVIVGGLIGFVLVKLGIG